MEDPQYLADLRVAEGGKKVPIYEYHSVRHTPTTVR
jgi:hypothetical protein